jgi:hypothetical protein
MTFRLDLTLEREGQCSHIMAGSFRCCRQGCKLGAHISSLVSLSTDAGRGDVTTEAACVAATAGFSLTPSRLDRSFGSRSEALTKAIPLTPRDTDVPGA